VAAALHALPGAAEDISSPSLAQIGSQTRGRSASGASGSDGGLISASGSSAPFTFRVAGPHADADTTVATDQGAVAKMQAADPDQRNR
jgi:hypothetical protein